MTIFLVFAGKYSDWEVCAACSSRDKAQSVANYIKSFPHSEDVDIREMELDVGLDKINDGLKLFMVGFYPNKGLWVQACSGIGMEEDCHRIINPVYHQYSVWAADEDCAIKIATERHAEWQKSQNI
jgi:hypothetical protein